MMCDHGKLARHCPRCKAAKSFERDLCLVERSLYKPGTRALLERALAYEYPDWNVDVLQPDGTKRNLRFKVEPTEVQKKRIARVLKKLDRIEPILDVMAK